jgi:hypothetical protein
MNLGESGVQIERSWKPGNGHTPYVFGGTTLEAFNHTLLADVGRQDVSSDVLGRGHSVDWDLVDGDVLSMTAEEQTKRNDLLVDIKMTTCGRRLLETGLRRRLYHPRHVINTKFYAATSLQRFSLFRALVK